MLVFYAATTLVSVRGQPTWSFVDLHPPGWFGSYAEATAGGQQAGYLHHGGGVHAVIWSGTATSFVDLDPTGTWGSAVSATTGSQQAGSVDRGFPEASIWSGTPQSWKSLHPPGAIGSWLSATTGSRQAGSANFGSGWHAGIWSGTPESFVDLHPAGAAGSSINGAASGQQAGVAYFGTSMHAALWSGSAATFVDLHPSGAEHSEATDLDAGQQVGWIQKDGTRHAALWTGSAESFVDLDPPGSGWSVIYDTTDGIQAGYASSGAGIWFGKADSFHNLQALLGSDYTDSRATEIWKDGDTIYVVGKARHIPSDSDHAILWVGVPEPNVAAFLALMVVPVVIHRRVRQQGVVKPGVWLAASVLLSAHVRSDTFGNGANTFTMDFVTVGNPGNPADITGNPKPMGSVTYVYRLGKYEVSRDMVTKANDAGSLGITLGDMSGVGGNGANRPATQVSWFEAATFVNWLNTSTGHLPAYNFVGGAFALWPQAEAWQVGGENLYRHKDTFYFLPSDQEWYKAACYDGVAGVYYTYATGSDAAPTPVAGGTTPGTAVYGQPWFQGPADIANAGGLSLYGTMAQGGNVEEWMESSWIGSNDSASKARQVRGGSWLDTAKYLMSSGWHSPDPTGEFKNLGFRVAAIPEPMESASVVALAALGFALWRRR